MEASTPPPIDVVNAVTLPIHRIRLDKRPNRRVKCHFRKCVVTIFHINFGCTAYAERDFYFKIYFALTWVCGLRLER